MSLLLLALLIGFNATWLRALFGMLVFERVRRATRYPTWALCAGLLVGLLSYQGWMSAGECAACALCGWVIVRMVLAVGSAVVVE
jgi:hypothetical protein